MRYLKAFGLYEAKKHPLEDILMDAMQNTVEGQDLAAVCNNRYRVDSKGKLVIEGLRGRTYIQQKADGSWEHWVLATGRVYGQGVHPTLEECLRGCWMDFLLNSTSIRPKGMNMEAFRDLVNANLSEFAGQALGISDLRDKSVEIMHRGMKTPIVSVDQFIKLPKWYPALQLLGLKMLQYKTQQYYQLFSDDSALVQIFFSPEELEGNNYLKNALTYGVAIKLHPYPILKSSIDYTGITIDIGGEDGGLSAFADSVWSSKKLHKALVDKENSFWKNDQGVLDRWYLIRQIGAEVLKNVASGQSLGDFNDVILKAMQGREFTFAQAKTIRDTIPEIWQAYVDTHTDGDNVKYAPILGEFF